MTDNKTVVTSLRELHAQDKRIVLDVTYCDEIPTFRVAVQELKEPYSIQSISLSKEQFYLFIELVGSISRDVRPWK